MNISFVTFVFKAIGEKNKSTKNENGTFPESDITEKPRREREKIRSSGWLASRRENWKSNHRVNRITPRLYNRRRKRTRLSSANAFRPAKSTKIKLFIKCALLAIDFRIEGTELRKMKGLKMYPKYSSVHSLLRIIPSSCKLLNKMWKLELGGKLAKLAKKKACLLSIHKPKEIGWRQFRSLNHIIFGPRDKSLLSRSNSVSRKIRYHFEENALFMRWIAREQFCGGDAGIVLALLLLFGFCYIFCAFPFALSPLYCNSSGRKLNPRTLALPFIRCNVRSSLPLSVVSPKGGLEAKRFVFIDEGNERQLFHN